MISIFTDTLMTLSSMFTVDLRKLPQVRNYSQTAGTLHHRHGQFRNPRRGSEDNNRQSTTSVKRCGTSRQRQGRTQDRADWAKAPPEIYFFTYSNL